VSKVTERIDVAIVGAGPFGLSMASFLPESHTRVFGPPLETWRTIMPPKMILRSSWEDATIGSPGEAGHMDRWIEAIGEEKPARVSLDSFLSYADWFQRKFVPEHDPARVESVARTNGHFTLELSSGNEVNAAAVVLAIGALPFAYAPPPLAEAIDGDRVRFVFGRHIDASPGERLAIVGGGQSALETAASAVRAGATVEVITRSRMRWFADREPDKDRGPVGRRVYNVLYPVVGFGPPPLNRFALAPGLFSRLPRGVRNRLNRRLLRAGGAPWLREAVQGTVTTTEGRTVVSVERDGESVRLVLDDGSVTHADRVLLATGFRFSLDRLGLLTSELRDRIGVSHGWPVIDRNLRSTTEPGIFFAGYPAEGMFGPTTRFVRGTRMAGPRIAAALASK
jgi:thioredoxin reductase